jgi:simple sugar transport system permease protein
VALAATAVALLAGLLALTDQPVLAALAALWRGALGSPDAIVSATLVRATPLILAGLAVALAFRAGVLNVGAEGQLLAGAATAAAVGGALAPMLAGATVVPAVLAGALAGACWAGIAALLRRRFEVLEVISTIMLNFVALTAVGLPGSRAVAGATRVYPQSATLAPGARLPLLIPGISPSPRLAAAAPRGRGALVDPCAPRRGFRCAPGDQPAGRRQRRLIECPGTRPAFRQGRLSLAGPRRRGGGHRGDVRSLREPEPGYGYTAIAVALLAKLHPLGVVGTGVLFGALEAGASAMQRDAGVPAANGERGRGAPHPARAGRRSGRGPPARPHAR